MAARRGRLGLTQQELADKAHVDLKTVYNLESGTRWPIARNRAAISAALNWEGDGLTVIAGGGVPDEAEGAAPPPVIPQSDGGPYAAIDELAAMLYQPVIRLRLAELAEHGDERPSGETLFLGDGGDPFGAGGNIAGGLADGWDEGMRRGLDLDTAVKFAARAWAMMAGYEARERARGSGRSGALVPT